MKVINCNTSTNAIYMHKWFYVDECTDNDRYVLLRNTFPWQHWLISPYGEPHIVSNFGAFWLVEMENDSRGNFFSWKLYYY